LAETGGTPIGPSRPISAHRPIGFSLARTAFGEYTTLMQAVEFESIVTDGGELAMPAGLAARLPRSQRVRVILLFNGDGVAAEDKDWSLLTAKEFFKGYAESDAMYDAE